MPTAIAMPNTHITYPLGPSKSLAHDLDGFQLPLEHYLHSDCVIVEADEILLLHEK